MLSPRSPLASTALLLVSRLGGLEEFNVTRGWTSSLLLVVPCHSVAKGLHPFRVPGLVGVAAMSRGEGTSLVQGIGYRIVQFLKKFVQLLVRNRIRDVNILVTHYFTELRPVSAGPVSCWGDVFEAKLKRETYGMVIRRIVVGVHLPVRDPPPEASRDGDVNA